MLWIFFGLYNYNTEINFTCLFLLFFFFKDLYIYLTVLVAGSSLLYMGFVCFCREGALFIAVHGFLIVAASLVQERRA